MNWETFDMAKFCTEYYLKISFISMVVLLLLFILRGILGGSVMTIGELTFTVVISFVPLLQILVPVSLILCCMFVFLDSKCVYDFFSKPVFIVKKTETTEEKILRLKKELNQIGVSID